MKTRLYPYTYHLAQDLLHQSGFTLPEVMMAMGLLVIVLGGTVAGHLFGIRVMDRTNAKASASAEARRNLNALTEEICSAKNVVVGNGSQTSFSQAGMYVPQKGGALQIYPSTNTNVFIRYYLDSSAKTLTRMTNGASTGVIVANGIKNSDLFTAEDFAGNILSNNQNNCVIGLALQFCQVYSANQPVGTNDFYTSYQVRSKIARRPF